MAVRMHRFQRLREQLQQQVDNGRQAKSQLLQNSRHWPVHPPAAALLAWYGKTVGKGGRGWPHTPLVL
ncbi:hypothetical protein PoB_005291300 [Plakobranchus ocellatus]|uniref:Uncharacterized protein n=1 Tax=Plakobranchus ocellatus TaxID=259542 RepID=A0AAV4C3B3_9GAST|nr:hypothetical protein PoB_005291300 [Plakobranchus ocellatus]